MRTPPLDGHPAYASAAHAARLIGRSDRIVQLWMREAGHAATWVPNAGYPVALLCEVCNRQKWPHQFTLTPEHFRLDTDASAIADETADGDSRANTAALAVLSKLDAIERFAASSDERQAAIVSDLAELRAQVAQLLADAERLRERDEKAAQSHENALLRHDAALERIEQAVRRRGFWARIFGR